MTSLSLELHYGRDHKAYLTNLNSLVKGTPFEKKQLVEVIIEAAKDPKTFAIFNNASQTWAHTFFWNSMSPTGGGEPKGPLLEKIKEDFGSFDAFRTRVKDTALAQFGSGWAWVCLDSQGKLCVAKTSNADLPFLHNLEPLVAIDLWEHAYYLEFQNRRWDYLDVVLNHLINWDFAATNMDSYMKQRSSGSK